MFTRARIATTFALMVGLFTSVTALAKGGFSFITITDPTFKEELRSTDSALTQDFFAFADFYRNKTSAPADPGHGYEIARYYLEGSREIAFDRLHYYPETGFVYYDGIVNGSSEYDGEWYTAKPEIKAPFESLLPVRGTDSLPSVTPATQPAPRLSFSALQLAILGAVGAAVLLWFTSWRRKTIAS